MVGMVTRKMSGKNLTETESARVDMVIALYYTSGKFKTVFKVPSQLW